MKTYIQAILNSNMNEYRAQNTGYDGTSCLTAKAGLTTNGLLHSQVIDLLK